MIKRKKKDINSKYKYTNKIFDKKNNFFIIKRKKINNKYTNKMFNKKNNF